MSYTQYAPVICPLCGQGDAIVLVTAPHAPRVLPVTDAEIADAAQQLGPAALAPVPPVTRQSSPRRSGCFVALLIVLGITLFLAGGVYGVYSPVCPEGELLKDFIGDYPLFVPHCVRDGVIYDPVREYKLPAGAVISTVGQWLGAGLFLWGCILPILRWFQGRGERRREQDPARSGGGAAVSQAMAGSVLPGYIARARGRVDAAYYCRRDDGFFIPGYPQFFRRQEWMHFLFS